MADNPLTFEKISIPGPVLAAVLHRCAAASGDSSGILFGRAVALPPRDLADDLSPSPSSSPSLAAVITSHLSSGYPSSFFDSLGRVDLHSPLLRSAPVPGSHLLGWFSSRRCSAIRPSMRERAVSLSFAQTVAQAQGSADLHQRPLIFLLVSSFASGNKAVHTHEYRAFVIHDGGRMEPRSVSIVNVGPSFRGQYGAFAPESPLPWMPCLTRRVGEEDGERETLDAIGQIAVNQRLLNASAEGFGIDKLGKLVGHGAAEYASEVEELYKKMLVKLDSLAEQVEESNARVLEQENRNIELRKRIAGLE